MFLTPYDVLAFMGRAEGDAAHLEQVVRHLETATQMVRAYTRGNGFDSNGDPDDALTAVIVSCTTRQLANPTHQTFTAIDDASFRPGVFSGWTLPELAILHNYRVRAR